MTVKNVARYDRVSKALESKVSRRPPTSVVGLITENVLVPIMKTVIVEKSSRARSSISGQRATKAIRPWKRDGGDATIPLLRAAPVRQTSNRFCCYEKKRTPNDQRNLTLPLFNNTAILRRSRDDKKSNVLPFPSPISVNPCPVPEHLPPRKRRKNRVDLDQRYVDHNTIANQHEPAQTKRRLTVNDHRITTNPANSFVSVNSSNLLNVTGNDTETETRRALSDLQRIDWLSTDMLTTIFDKAVRLLETDSFGINDSFGVTDSIGITDAFTIATSPACIATVSAVAATEPVTVTTTEAEVETTTSVTVTTTEAEVETTTAVTVTTTEAEVEATTAVTTTATDVCQSLFNIFVAEKLFGSCNELVVSKKNCDDTDCSIIPTAAAELSEDVYPCKLKYSWEVLGKNTQTSRTLLEYLIQETFDDTATYACSIKYSWQIIGIGTQTSKEDLVASRLSARSYVIRNVDGTSSKSSSKPSSKPSSQPSIKSPATAKLPRRISNKVFLSSTQGTQTCAHKEIQTNFIEFYANQQ